MAVRFTLLPGSEQPDRMFGTSKAEFMYGNLGSDLIKGGGGNDLLLGDDSRFTAWPSGAAAPPPSDDRLHGGSGDDVLVGGADDDVMFGGSGRDTFVFDRWDRPYPDFGENYPTPGTDVAMDFRRGQDKMAIAVEVLDSDNQLHYNHYVPFDIFDSNGNGVLDASDEHVRIEQATFEGRTALSTVIERGHSYGYWPEGNDVVLLGVTGVTADDFVTPGTDMASPYYFDAWKATVTGLFGDDRISATSGNDVINDLGGDDTIRGLDGDDVIDGGIGDDMVLGGRGADRLLGQNGDDQLYGEAGDDTLFGGGGYNRLFGGVGDDQLDVDGEYLGSGRGLLDGGAGNDVLRGGTGSDTLRGGVGDDVLTGSGVDYWGLPASKPDVLDGGNGNDILSDGPSADLISGGAGDDRFHLSKGSNTVSGGAGADLFIREASLGQSDSPDDSTIVDFVRGSDRLGLASRLGDGLASFAELDTNGNGVIDGRDAGWTVSGVAVDGHVRSSLVFTQTDPSSGDWGWKVTLYAVNRLDAQDIFAGSSY